MTALTEQLAESCRLYNAALQERREAYKQAGVSLTYSDQANQLKRIRAEGACTLANFSACQDVLRRVDKTFQAFFGRVKRGEKAGYPRFKARARFDSYTFPSYGDGCRLRPGGKLSLQGIGELKVKLHRPVAGTIKTITVKREARSWYVCFSVEVVCPGGERQPEAVGMDLGLSSFAVLSDGTVIDNPRWYRTSMARLRRAQRCVARRKRRSHRRRKAVACLQRAHFRIANQRRNFHHQLARSLVGQYGTLSVEDVNILGLSRGMLARSMHDAGWRYFLTILEHKAAEAGAQVVKVDPRGTSQTCPCGAPVPKTLRDRWHHCDRCGLDTTRDHEQLLDNLRRKGLPTRSRNNCVVCSLGKVFCLKL
jgi:putative transposase